MATSVKSHLNKLGIYYNTGKASQMFLPGVTARRFSDNRLQRQPNSLPNTIIRPNITSNQYISWPAATQIHKFPASIRHYSSQNGDEPSVASRKSLPQLMSFPQIVWPSVFKTIKNWIMINFIIRPYFDNEFNVNDFVAGTKHALQVWFYFNHFSPAELFTPSYLGGVGEFSVWRRQVTARSGVGRGSWRTSAYRRNNVDGSTQRNPDQERGYLPDLPISGWLN